MALTRSPEYTDNMWPTWLLECTQWFSVDDLLSYPMWPTFKQGLDFIKTHILIKFHEDWGKNATSRVNTKFSKIFADDLVFNLMWPSFELGLDFIKTHILTKFHEDSGKNAASRVNTSFFLRFELVT